MYRVMLSKTKISQSLLVKSLREILPSLRSVRMTSEAMLSSRMAL